MRKQSNTSSPSWSPLRWRTAVPTAAVTPDPPVRHTGGSEVVVPIRFLQLSLNGLFLFELLYCQGQRQRLQRRDVVGAEGHGNRTHAHAHMHRHGHRHLHGHNRRRRHSKHQVIRKRKRGGHITIYNSVCKGRALLYIHHRRRHALCRNRRCGGRRSNHIHRGWALRWHSRCQRLCTHIHIHTYT